MRRVDYYVKHLIVDADGNFFQVLEWIGHSKDPKIVCYPVLIFVSDVVWSRVASRTFLYQNAWFLLALAVFIPGQPIVQYLHDEMHNPDVVKLICRLMTCSFATRMW